MNEIPSPFIKHQNELSALAAERTVGRTSNFLADAPTTPVTILLLSKLAFFCNVLSPIM